MAVEVITTIEIMIAEVDIREAAVVIIRAVLKLGMGIR